MGEGVISELAGILRPHLKSFILFCYMYFKIVAIWSAGKKKYVHEIVRLVFADTKEPNLIFSRECSEDKGRIEKPLQYMFNVPFISNYMNLKNTLVIDDRLDTFMDVNLKNGIVIPEFKPTFTLKGLMSENNALAQLMIWLCQSEVANSTDVRLLDKSNIFKLPLDQPINFDFISALNRLKKNCITCKIYPEVPLIDNQELIDEKLVEEFNLY